MSYAVPIGARHRAPSPLARRFSVLQFQAGDPDLASEVDVTPEVRTPLWRRVPGYLLNVVVLLGVLAFVGLALGPHVLGYRTATMLTGSMEPGIAPGDVVVTVERPAAELQVGDVVSYHIPIEDHRVETHRVTEVDVTRSGEITMRTKGDSNAGVDPWVATIEGDTVWEVVAVVPKLGTAIQALRAPGFHNVILWLSIGALVLLGLNLIWGSSSEDEESDR